MRRSFWAGAAGLLLSISFFFVPVARAQSPITCANPSPAPDPIRQEGGTEQIGDYSFTCSNPSSISPVTMTVTATVSATVTSEILNGNGASEVTLLVTNSDSTVIGQAQGTISGPDGNVVTFVLPNFALPTGTSYFDITNIRVDATSLDLSSGVTEIVSVTGTGVTTANFAAQQLATVFSGITSSLPGATTTNYGAGATVTSAASAFMLKFGEGGTLPNAFKTQGGSGNNTEGSWLSNNTETGYFVIVGNFLNIANSGTRIRMIFNNIPAGMNVYVPINIGTDQLGFGAGPPFPVGNALLTTSEAGVFSQASAAAPQPSGYTGTAQLAQLTVSGGSAEAVYEIQSDSASTLESYTVPVYVTGTVPSHAANMTAAVSFAPVNAISNIPYFAQLAATTSTLNASQFSLNITSTSPLPQSEVGLAYNQQLNATQGTGPYTWALASGAASLTTLGLNLGGNGAITGTPTSPGTATFTVTATDSAGASTTSASFTLVVNPALTVLTTAPLPAGTINAAYSTTLSAAGGVGAYTWAIVGSLPPGFHPINFSGPGVISGTPITAGSYSFTITVTDSLGAVASLGLANNPLVINGVLAVSTANSRSAELVGIDPPAGLTATQAGTANDLGSAPVATNNAIVVGFNLPSAAAGLSISAYVSSGAQVTAFLGTQTGANANINNQVASTTFTGSSDITRAPTVIFPNLSLTAGTYYLTLVGSVASNAGNAPQWGSVTASVGPQIVNAAGGVAGFYQGQATVVAGYPPASTFTVQTAQQTTGTPTWLSFMFDVDQALPGVLPAATVGIPYNATMTATGCIGACTWSLPASPSPPPAWISINQNTGVLSGTPTAKGTYTFQVIATDSQSNAAALNLSLLVNFANTVITANLPAGMAIINLSGASATATVGGNGASNSFNGNGSSQSQWSAPFNTASQFLEYTLPPGAYTMRAINPADALAAFPALTQAQQNSMWTAWTYNSPWLDDFLVFDSIAATNSQTQLFSGATGSGGPGNAAAAYANVIAGKLENNLAFQYRNATPLTTVTIPVQGTGAETLLFAVPDSDLGDNQAGVSILIAPATSTPSVSTESLQNAQVGVAYNTTGFQMQATGGSGIYQWSAAGLPTGMSISYGGLITGTPTVYNNGSFSVTFTVEDPVSGLTSTSTLTLVMNLASPAISLSPAPASPQFPKGEINVAYSTQLTASGGLPGYTYRLTNNSSPLIIDSSTGIVSSDGSPLTGGNNTSFTVQVTDAAGEVFTSGAYTLLVNSAVTINAPAINQASVGESWAATFTTSGGTTIITNWTGANLPPGLSLSQQGVLSGTPTATGTFPFSITVTDSAGGTSTVNPSLTVGMPVTYLVVNSSNGGGVGTASLQQVSGDGTVVSTLASGAGMNAADMALDGYGNAILATGPTLNRVVPLAGLFSTVAVAPNGSQWAAVAVDKAGNFIVGDNKAHAIWRVSADGATVVSIAHYPVNSQALNENVKVAVLPNGNYFVASDNVPADAPIALFTITPAGAVTQLSLSGTLAYGVGGMTPDGNGGYMLLDTGNNRLVDFTTAGVGTFIATVNDGANAPLGLARNPLTGDFIVGFEGGLTKVNSTGSSVTQFATSPATTTNLGYPLAVAALPIDFPATVDSTNPLAYFRLENSTGTSEGKGTYTYTDSGGATVSRFSVPPIGVPANNYAVLDGNSGEITTSLSGGIATAGSMMAWVNLAVLPSNGSNTFNYIAGESAQSNDFDLQFLNTNVLGFFTTCCGTSLNYTPNPNTLVGQWHMVVATFDAVAGTRSIYWDGVPVAADNCSGCAGYENKTGTFWLGNTSNNANFGNRFFDGSLDDAAVWNYALSPAQVYQMYASRPPASSGVLTSVAPTTASAGAASVSLTIAGLNFATECSGPCSMVSFIAPAGDLPYVLTPLSATANTITATIPALAVANPGIAEVTVLGPTGIPSNALPLTILGPLAITPANTTLPNATVSQLYNQPFTASGGSGNYSWSVPGNNAGLSMTPATGASVALTGTPESATTDGPFSVTVQLTDTTTNATTSTTYQLTVNAQQGPPAGSQPANTTLYVLSEDGSIYSLTNGTPTRIVSAAVCDGCFENDLARDGAGNLIVAEGHDVTAYTAAGAPISSYSMSAGESGSYFESVVVDSTGTLIIADSGQGALLKLESSGPQTIANFSGNYDAYVRIDSQGNYIVVTDTFSDGGPNGISIFKISPAGAVTPVTVTPAASTLAPLSVAGLTFDASGNYVITDWSQGAIYTITPSGTSTPLFTDPNHYFSDLFGISRDRVGGSYFFVDDDVDTLNSLSSDGSTVNQISGSVGSPSAVVVADTAAGGPLTFTPAPGTLTAGYTGVPYSLPLAASGGSGNYSWQVVSESTGLNLLPPAVPTGASISFTGTPKNADTDAGLTIVVQLTDTVTLLTVRQTYTIPVNSSALWTAAGTFDDGGTLSGSFNYGSGAVNLWNVTTSSGSTLNSSFTFTPSNSTAHYFSGGGNGCTGICAVFTSNQQFPAANGNQPRVLALSFDDSLDNNFGSAVSLETEHSDGSSGSYECLQCSPIRYLTTGSVSSGVPIGPQLPGTVAYILEENGGVDAAAGGQVTQLSPGNEGFCCLDFAVDSANNFIIASGGAILGTASNGAPLPNFSPVVPEGDFIGSIAIDSNGNYIVSDERNSQILRYAPPTVNNPSPQPVVVASLPVTVDGDVVVRIDSSGNYIVLADNANSDDGSNQQLFAFSITPAGAITPIPLTIPDGVLPPISACGMTFDASGNYVDVDCYNDEIYTIAKAGAANQGTVSVLFGDPNGFLSDPLGITRDPHTGNFFVADDGNDSIFTFAPDGSNFSQVLSGGLLSLNSDPGAVLIADTTPPNTVDYALQRNGSLVATVGGATLNCGDNCDGNAYDLAVDASGNFIIAAVGDLVKLTPAGGNSIIGETDSAQWVSVAVDSSGNYIVVDNSHHQLQIVSPGGEVTNSIGYNVAAPDVFEDAYVRIDSAGNYIVAEDNAGEVSALNQIYKITPAGAVTTLTITASPIGRISGLTFDAAGNYVVSASSPNAIYVLTPAAGNTLAATVLSNNGTLDGPQGLFRDPVNGNYLVGNGDPGGLYSLNAPGTQLTPLLNNVANPVATLSVTFGIGTTSLTAGAQGQTYAPVDLTGIGGSGTYTWSATGLPPGMTLSADGILSGVPLSSGTFQVHITLTDTDGHSTVVILSLSITGNAAAPPPPPVTPPLTITTGALTGGTVGLPYAASVSASGGSGSYSFTMVGAPAGLGISSSGLISGIPTTPGTFTFTVSVTSASLFAQQSYTIAIAPPPLTISGPNGLGGFAPSGSVSASYTAGGGTSPYKWSAQNLPAGLTLNASSGAITGSVASPGNYSFTVQVADSQSLTTSLAVTMYVLGIGTSKLPDGTNHVAYSQSLSAIGGPGPYTWNTSGSLPPGLLLASSGVISGTPALASSITTPQNFTFGVSLTEGTVTVNGNVSITITLVPEPISVSGGALSDASLNVGYSQALTAAGGAPPYTWSVLAGSMPPGMGLNSSGTFSGTPTSIGSFGFTAQVKDTSGGTAAAGFTINVDPPGITITTGSPLPDAIAGSAYPTQSFAATGGIGPYTFAVTAGSLPAGLSMSDGTITGTPSAVGSSSFTVTASDSSSPALTTTAEYQISVSQPHTDLVLSSTSLSFSLFVGATAIPAPDVVTVGSSGTQNLGYTLSVTPAVSWLDITGGGTTPDDIKIALDPKASALPAGPVKTSIVVTCVTPTGASAVPCAGNSQNISVSLNVINAPPLLSVGPGLLSFSGLIASPGSTTQSLIVQNNGGGTITLNSITSPDKFVSVGAAPASIGAGASASVGITVNTLGVAAGYYQSSLLISTSAGSATVPLTLLVASNPTLVLAPSGMQFQMVAGSSPGNPNGSLTVDVNSASAVNWHAAVLPGASWLTISTTTVSSTSAAPGKVTYTINPTAAAALTVGTYYGTIEITSGGIVNSPQDFLVVLNVNAAPDLLQPDPEPAGLIFITNGTSAVPSQTVNVYSGSTSPLAFLASVSSSDKWLSVTVSGSGTAGVGAAGSSIVSVNTVGMSAGVYRGTVSYQFIGSGASAGVRSVNVTLIIQKASAIPSVRNGNAEPGVLKPQQQTSGCAPSQLVPTQTGLVNAFSQPASWPTPLNILLTDDCGNPQPNGQVVVTFSNGDAPLELSPMDTISGNFAATWTPRNAANQITIAAQGTASGFAPAVAQISGAVTPKATPVLTPNGTLNVFAPVVGAPIAPGTIIQIYGSNLSGQPSTATNIPLPTKLNATQVLIGGHLAPLYYVSSGQINAQVPFELNAGQSYQLIVNANGALSTPNPIQLSTVAPGVAQFTDGQVIAQHLDGSLITDSSPAAPNEIIVFYVAGMGQTSQSVSTGDASATANLALDPPTLTVGGIPVTNILYAGLTPTLVGLYQVDFQVPATAPAGDQPMVLTQSGQGGQSNTTVLPVSAPPQQ